MLFQEGAGAHDFFTSATEPDGLRRLQEAAAVAALPLCGLTSTLGRQQRWKTQRHFDRLSNRLLSNLKESHSPARYYAHQLCAVPD